MPFAAKVPPPTPLFSFLQPHPGHCNTHTSTDSNTEPSTYSKVELGPKVSQHFMQVGQSCLLGRSLSLSLFEKLKHYSDTWVDYFSSSDAPLIFFSQFFTHHFKPLILGVPSTPLHPPFLKKKYFNVNPGLVKICLCGLDLSHALLALLT